jgi:uncharacterized membrane protein YkgB
MVEKNNQSEEQDYQELQRILSQKPKDNRINTPTEKTSTGKKIGIVVLIILGVVIAIPFLLFIACLGMIVVSN